MLPRPTIDAFAHFLDERGLRLEAVAIGGSALALLGVVDRPTRDLDILHPDLPADVAAASREFAAKVRASGEVLADDWLNNGPKQLGDVLPSGWLERLQPLYDGAGLSLRTLGRGDLLKSKLFALCDRGTDLSDCVALRPTRDELLEAAPWVSDQDGNPAWPAHVRATLANLAGKLGDEL